MWNTKKNLRANVVSEIEYNDFASLKIEKKVKNNITIYTLFINIYDVLEEELDFYKLEDISEILVYIKNSIEKLDREIDDLSDEEYLAWINEFKQKINEY